MQVNCFEYSGENITFILAVFQWLYFCITTFGKTEFQAAVARTTCIMIWLAIATQFSQRTTNDLNRELVCYQLVPEQRTPVLSTCSWTENSCVINLFYLSVLFVYRSWSFTSLCVSLSVCLSISYCLILGHNCFALIACIYHLPSTL